MVGSAVQNGVRLIVVVNGLEDPEDRATEAKKMLEWGFRNFEVRTAVRSAAADRLCQGVRRRQPLGRIGQPRADQGHGAEERQRQADRAHRL